jgi:hypothetical protein
MLSQHVLCKRESLGTIGKRLFSGEGEGKYRSRNETKRDRSLGQVPTKRDRSRTKNKKGTNKKGTRPEQPAAVV